MCIVPCLLWLWFPLCLSVLVGLHLRFQPLPTPATPIPKGERPPKPRSPDDCAQCRETPTPAVTTTETTRPPVRPWSERKRKRGRPKILNCHRRLLVIRH